MLGTKYPEVIGLNRYFDSFSERRVPLAYSVGRDSRFKLGKSASCPGPGHYRVEREHPFNELDDFGSVSHTGSRAAPKYTMPVEPRMNTEGALKGIVQYRGSSVGPGHYSSHRLSIRSQEKSFPAYTIPSAKETAEAVRNRKKASDVPGPGVYNILRYGDDLAKEKQKAMERAVRRGTNCWAAAQYSHLFSAMKPRSSGTQALSPLDAAASATKRPSQDPQESTPAA